MLSSLENRNQEAHRENHFQLVSNRIAAGGLHQQLEPATARENDGCGPRAVRHDRRLSRRLAAAL
jgi:hypothetical protein